MISKELFLKQLDLLQTDSKIVDDIEREAKESEVIQSSISNFNQFMQSIGVPENTSLKISELVGLHFVLYERLAREDERANAKVITEVVQNVAQRKMSKDNFKCSIKMLAEEYTKSKDEKQALEKVLSRIK